MYKIKSWVYCCHRRDSQVNTLAKLIRIPQCLPASSSLRPNVVSEMILVIVRSCQILIWLLSDMNLVLLSENNLVVLSSLQSHMVMSSSQSQAQSLLQNLQRQAQGHQASQGHASTSQPQASGMRQTVLLPQQTLPDISHLPEHIQQYFAGEANNSALLLGLG